MYALINNLKNDEAGFIVSAELVLVGTIAVLGMIVGLAEVAWNVNTELEDVGSAFANLNQSYYASGTSGHKASTRGFCFHDYYDHCSGQSDLSCDN